jgi:hypothetical protein
MHRATACVFCLVLTEMLQLELRGASIAEGDTLVTCISMFLCNMRFLIKF